MFCTTLNFTKGRSLEYKNTHFFVKLKNCGTFAEDPDGKSSLCLIADNRHNSGFFYFSFTIAINSTNKICLS